MASATSSAVPVVRAPLSAAVPDVDPCFYQYERYLGAGGRSFALTAYYAFKPFLPRRLQLLIRRAYAHRQAAREFPAWPFEPVLVDHFKSQLSAALDASASERVAFVGLWPQRYRSACILTHDVEGVAGIESISRVLELESRYGLHSSWNFVAEGYPIPARLFDDLRTAGCEVGVHGIKHDGKLFQTRSRFAADLPKIHEYLERWNASGFRSPALHRRADWMHELGCLYDSSFPDSDPFEPQPGGCCSIWPFMFGDVVELPITLLQDHTLWEVLCRDSCELWLRKSDWLLASHGLVNINTHPDYFTTPARFAMYEEFLAHVADQPGCWHALPREVASWWKARERMSCSQDGDSAGVVDDPGDRAAVWWAHARTNEIEFEI